MTDAAEPLEAPALITRDLVQLLAVKYPVDRFALFFDVPDDVGMHARRRADAIAVGIWKSVGHSIDGFELKASRSDWLRELKSVDKADPFLERCDRWWLVTTTQAIAKLEEIPACWGWMAAGKGGLRIQKPAPLLRPGPLPSKVDRLFMIGILRKFQDGILNAPEVVAREIERQRGIEARVAELVEARVASAERAGAKLREKVEHFEKETGLRLEAWESRGIMKAAKALHALEVWDSERYNKVSRIFDEQLSTLEHLCECVRLARASIQEVFSAGEPPDTKRGRRV